MMSLSKPMADPYKIWIILIFGIKDLNILLCVCVYVCVSNGIYNFSITIYSDVCKLADIPKILKMDVPGSFAVLIYPNEQSQFRNI